MYANESLFPGNEQQKVYKRCIIITGKSWKCLLSLWALCDGWKWIVNIKMICNAKKIVACTVGGLSPQEFVPWSYTCDGSRKTTGQHTIIKLHNIQ